MSHVSPTVVDRPLVVCGPSGTGKSTLLKALFAKYPGEFGFSVSHTTRSPRAGEENGREYHFVSRDEFLQRVENGEFLEWAEFGGNCYGTTFAALRGLAPRRCILDIDLQGVKQLHVAGPKQAPPLEPVFLFLSPPSVGHLKDRLAGRGTETEESTRKRLAAAKAEIEHALTGAHDLVIVNDDVARAGALLEQVALGQDGWDKVGDDLPQLNVHEL
ncbi:guanylate kinase [Vanrija albida]|uniref:guanylate kinase n=1 Tax=Vanrija albida TaxID=181172 RepID=A0ABR3QAZ1_9TREE